MSNDLHDRLAAVGIEPCGDNSCIFGRRGGMNTNGGCRHLKDLHTMSVADASRLVQAMAHVLRSTLPARPAAEIERLVERAESLIRAIEDTEPTLGRARIVPREKATGIIRELIAALATPAPAPADLAARIDRARRDGEGHGFEAGWQARGRAGNSCSRGALALAKADYMKPGPTTPLPSDLAALLLAHADEWDSRGEPSGLHAEELRDWARANLPPLATGGA